MNIKIFQILFFCSLATLFSLIAEENVGRAFPSLSQKMQFSSDVRQTLSDETPLPNQRAPLSTLSYSRPPESSKSNVKMEVFDYGNGSWRLTFCFPEKVVYTLDATECWLYLQFNQNVDSPDLIKIQENLGYIIKRISTGYNTLFFVAKRPVCFQAYSFEGMFVLDIIPNYEEASESTRNLKIARARLLIEERHYVPAFCALYEILDEYPCNKEATILLAELEGLLPRWQEKYHLLEALHNTYPCDRDIQVLLEDAFFPHSSYLKYEWTNERTIGLAAEQIHKLQYEWIKEGNPDYYLYWGGLFMAERGHIAGVVNSLGETVGFLGTRHQGSLYFRKEDHLGKIFIARGYVGEGGVYGGGVEATWLWPYLQGNFTILADWHHPYWEIFETLAFFGREDRIKCRVNSVFNRFFKWNLEAGARRVGIRDVPNGYDSILLSGNVFYEALFPNPNLYFNYAIDAEYVVHRTEKIGIAGNEFAPVPLTSFEFHSLRVYFARQCKRWYYLLFVGETFNRLGTNDITGGFTVKYIKPCPCPLELELSAYRFPSTTNAGAAVDYVTASVTFRF